MRPKVSTSLLNGPSLSLAPTAQIPLDVIHDYLHFQLETGHDPDGWNAAHATYDEVTSTRVRP